MSVNSWIHKWSYNWPYHRQLEEHWLKKVNEICVLLLEMRCNDSEQTLKFLINVAWVTGRNLELCTKPTVRTSKISIQTKANYPLWDRNQNTLPFDSGMTLTLKWLWPWDDLDLDHHINTSSWPYPKNLVFNSQNKHFYQSDLDHHPMTLIPKLDLDMVKILYHTKNEVSVSKHSKVIGQTDRQTHTHTHTQYENITFPHTRVVTMLQLLIGFSDYALNFIMLHYYTFISPTALKEIAV